MRRPIEMGNPLLFFTMVIVLFPLGLGPAPDKLAIFAPGVLWITALLSNLLTSDAVFRSDFDDGSLEQLVLAPQPLFLSLGHAHRQFAVRHRCAKSARRHWRRAHSGA
jgi:heme exporter protein B